MNRIRNRRRLPSIPTADPKNQSSHIEAQGSHVVTLKSIWAVLGIQLLAVLCVVLSLVYVVNTDGNFNAWITTATLLIVLLVFTIRTVWVLIWFDVPSLKHAETRRWLAPEITAIIGNIIILLAYELFETNRGSLLPTYDPFNKPFQTGDVIFGGGTTLIATLIVATPLLLWIQNGFDALPRQEIAPTSVPKKSVRISTRIIACLILGLIMSAVVVVVIRQAEENTAELTTDRCVAADQTFKETIGFDSEMNQEIAEIYQASTHDAVKAYKDEYRALNGTHTSLSNKKIREEIEDQREEEFRRILSARGLSYVDQTQTIRLYKYAQSCEGLEWVDQEELEDSDLQ